MTRSPLRPRALALTALGGAMLLAAPGTRPAIAQHGHDHGATGATSTPATPPAGARGGVRISMDELHRGGGVPRGWRFTWPDGDAKKGREVFAKLECYQCHEVKGEPFPPVAQDPSRRGPALAGMGDHHPAEYLAESILNPNAVILTGPGYTGPDGLSIMPDFRDSLTLAETIDLVAYIRSLTGGGPMGHGATAAREQVTADYRVRVAYADPKVQAGGHHMHHGGGAGSPLGHLMVFVTDAASGEPRPYLPVTATVLSATTPARTVTMAPMVSDGGFHYGANVTLPADISKVTVAIGKPTIAVTGVRAPRATSVTFEWSR